MIRRTIENVGAAVVSNAVEGVIDFDRAIHVRHDPKGRLAYIQHLVGQEREIGSTALGRLGLIVFPRSQREAAMRDLGLARVERSLALA